jgi:hypothetical protein
MTFASPKLLEARAYLKGQDADLNNDEVGIVGGPSHIATGTSYHLGKDQLKMSKNPYSARTARDKAGLANPATANMASALDVDDDLDELRDMSVWIVEQCRRPNPHPDTLDIREIIYSPDGVTVFTWDREKGQTSAPERRGDSSHREHSHFDWYRDAGQRDKVGIFRRYFERNNPTGGDDMIPILFGEGEKPGPRSSRVGAMQRALIRAGADLSGAGGPDGRYGQGTANALIEVLGPEIAGDGKLYDDLQYDALQPLAYGGGAKGDKGDPGPAGPPGATPTAVTFGPVVATVTEVTVPPAV